MRDYNTKNRKTGSGRGQCPRMFLRDDDAGVWSEHLGWMLEQVQELRIPLVCAVIPAALDGMTCRRLAGMKRKHPELLDIVQHGWSHADHSRPGENKYEFGPSRSPARQLCDILRGRLVMEKRFKGLWTRAFVPPFHGFDDHTLLAAASAGFRVFSAGRSPVLAFGSLQIISAGAALNSYPADGSEVLLPLAGMRRELRAALNSGPVSGLVVHHQSFNTPACRKRFGLFLKYFSAEESKGRLKLITFSDICRK